MFLLLFTCNIIILSNVFGIIYFLILNLDGVEKIELKQVLYYVYKISDNFIIVKFE